MSPFQLLNALEHAVEEKELLLEAKEELAISEIERIEATYSESASSESINAAYESSFDSSSSDSSSSFSE
jgi:hypothetical protein